MRNKKYNLKNAALALGTLTAVASPIIAVVSCGTSDKTDDAQQNENQNQQLVGQHTSDQIGAMNTDELVESIKEAESNGATNLPTDLESLTDDELREVLKEAEASIPSTDNSEEDPLFGDMFGKTPEEIAQDELVAKFQSWGVGVGLSTSSFLSQLLGNASDILQQLLMKIMY